MRTLLAWRTSRVAGTVLCGCVVALGLSGCSDDDDATSDDVSSSEELSMVGTWTGHRERMASTEGYREGTATLIVTEQTGLTFVGTMGWSTPEGEESDPLVAAFTPGGSLMAGADDEGIYRFDLIDSTTLDYCYSEDGEGYRTTCARLEKEE